MSLKSWVVSRVHRMGSLSGRPDLAPREPAPDTAHEPAHEAPDADYLGAYAPLVAAIRDELEHFVASHVRLHLAIAEHDRFLLTSIGVRCAGGADARALLRQFMREFKPEQIKRYLAREVIAALPNASAIDLSQFAGLVDADARDDATDEGEYRELIAALRATPELATPRPYEVSVLGRWSELDPARPVALAPGAVGTVNAVNAPAPVMPASGLRCEFDIEDGDGKRRVVLQSVVPGRRYVVGNGEGCDIRVNGTYASRRHAEIWLADGAWWVADAGSTNGLRVETPGGATERGGTATLTATLEQPVRLAEGARIVLSARADGPPRDYPSVAMRPGAGTSGRLTPIAAAAAAPKTPLTAIAPARGEPRFVLSARLASGVRTVELEPGALPVSIGRSRSQTLVVDRRHEGVSGHHLDITALDAAGAEIVVHGDNGVWVDGVPHETGARLHWQPGQTLLLGASPHEPSPCTLTLARRGAE